MERFLYTDPETFQLFKVTIINFSRSDDKIVRVQGGVDLNPSNGNYPDKKWVNISDLAEIKPVNFSKEFINQNLF